MDFDATLFSRDLKIARYAYQYGDTVNHTLIEEYLTALKQIDLTLYKHDIAKLAFWLNVYNGMTNYAIVCFQIENSMKELPDLFKRRFFSVSGIDFSLDDIEHGVLRRNAKQH